MAVDGESKSWSDGCGGDATVTFGNLPTFATQTGVSLKLEPVLES